MPRIYFREHFLYLLIIPARLSLYHRQILNVLYQIFPAERKAIAILTETIHAYYNFIKGMLIVYIIVGTLNSIGLALLAFHILFFFIASIPFIPYMRFWTTYSYFWITFNSIWYPLGSSYCFFIVQILEAYVIFPFAVGSRLKIIL
jgi:predicted PurR-regulated permease PerM